MLARLFACLALCLLVASGQDLRWEAAFQTKNNEAPEPRSFANVAGLPNSSMLIMYGGYSHVRGMWLHEVWSLRTNDSNPTWRRLHLEADTEPVPVMFPALVSLGGSLLLVGGCYEDSGSYSRHIFKFDLSGPRWTKVTVTVADEASVDMPGMYRHAAVRYTFGGSERVLIAGGLNHNSNATTASTYELSFDKGNYSLTTMPNMPSPLLGHSLIAAGDPTTLYAIGGLKKFSLGSLNPALPALPAGLAGLLRSPEAPNKDVYTFNITSQAWDVSNALLPAACTFAAGWHLGSSIYLYGGVRHANTSALPGPLVLDVTSGSIALIANAGREANATWGAVQPGAVAGAAVWVDTSGPDQGKPAVWLFGGVTAPWPLPAAADTYFSPQDISLTWRLVRNASAGAGSHGAWLAPLPGAMAPRSGAMVVPVTVDGQQKLLSLGGSSLAGWTDTTKRASQLKNTESFKLSPEYSETARSSYQLYDIWLIDVASGVAEPVWCINSTSVGPAARCADVPGSGSGGGGGGGGCASLPFGNAASGAWLGWLWDRRLLPYTVSGVDGGGDGNSAFYMHTEETLNRSLMASIWRLSLSTTTLTTAAAGDGGGGSFQTYVATWQLLSSNLLSSQATAQATCYPRLMYGVAHLTSTAENVSYIAMYGGLAIINLASTLYLKEIAPKDSACLLEVDSHSTGRWLVSTDPAEGGAPKPRYRHACAPHPGLQDFSMTCLGGLSSLDNKPLGDAWTLTVQPGVTMQSETVIQFMANWEEALEDLAAVRPGRRADAFLVPVRGSSPSWNSSYSPLLLLGGRIDAAETAVRTDAWLLDATCADPAADVPNALADITQSVERRMQLWQAILPKGTLAQVASSLELPAEWRPGSVVGVLGTQTEVAVWLVLVPADGNATDLRFAKMVSSPPWQGCLSPSVRPNCRNTDSYAKNATVARLCRPDAFGGISRNVDVSRFGGDPFPDTALFRNSLQFLVLDESGAGVHYSDVTVANPKALTITDLQLPAAADVSGLSIVSYGLPYVRIDGSVWSRSVKFIFVTQIIFVKVLAVVTKATTAVVGANLELRVRYNGLYRALGCGACAIAKTSGTGNASFLVFPIKLDDVELVSYAVVITAPDDQNYVVPLQTPTPAPTPGTVRFANNVTVQLEDMSGLPSGLLYTITLPYRSEPQPTNALLSINVTFGLPGGAVVNYPTQRGFSGKWLVLFFTNHGGGDDSPLFCVSGTYQTRVNYTALAGRYSIKVVDSRAPSPFLTERNNVSLDSLKDIVVPMASVAFDVRFAGFAYPASTSEARSRLVWLRLKPINPDNDYVIAAGVQGCEELRPNFVWFDGPLGSSSNKFTVVPLQSYVAELYIPLNGGNGEFKLSTINFSAPGVDFLPTEQSVVLPQTLLCPAQTTIIRSTAGSIPLRNITGTVFYGPSCTWVFSMGKMDLELRINCRAFARTDELRVFTRDRLFDASNCQDSIDGIWRYVFHSENVTLKLSAIGDNITISLGAIEWVASGSSDMPPHFIMMIGAAAAAAGSMLLILCLWHCVFRPVQLRRQQAAAALAAAASAAPANTAGTAGSGGRGPGSRNHVPRRYLRMMETSTYSAKDSLKVVATAVNNATAAGAAVVANAGANGDGNGHRGGPTLAGLKATPAVEPAASVVEPSSHGSGDAAHEAASGAAAPSPQPENGVGDGRGGGDAMMIAVRPAGASAAAAAMAAKDSAPGCDPDLGGSGGEVCAICLCDFEEGERIKHLPCKHFYHVPCIDQWLGRDITCPLCKDNVLEAMHTLFGPLPPKGTHRQGSRQIITSGGGAAAGAAIPPTPGGGTAGVPPTPGADVEMVIIVDHGPDGGGAGAAAATGVVTAAGTESQAAGPRSAAGPLPGHVGSDSWDEGAVMTVRSLSPAAAAVVASEGAAADLTDTPRSVRPPLRVGDTPAGATGGRPSAQSSAAPAAPPLWSQSTGLNSRELRPMRRNISNDLTPDPDGTSTDSGSGSSSESEASTSAANARGRVGSASGIEGSSNNSPSRGRDAFAVANAPTPGAAAASAAASRGGTMPYVDVAAGGPPLHPSHFMEHLQHSPTNTSAGSTAMRWLGGSSSQVVPMPMPRPPVRTSTSAVHRLPRAQEAQMAAAAAALNAAAAGVSSGGNSWRSPSVTSTGGDGASCILWGPHAAAAAAAAASFAAAHPNLPPPLLPPPLDASSSAILSYRVHTNPLALSQRSSAPTAASSFSTADDAINAASSSPRAPLNVIAITPSRPPPPVQPGSGGSSPSSVLVLQSGPAPHAVSVLSAGGGGAAAAAGPSWLGRSRCNSTGSAGAAANSTGRPLGGGGASLAVPEVSTSSEDFIRTPSSKAGGGTSGGGSGGAPAGGAY